MFESYFKQVKYILGSKDGKDKKLEKIELLTGLVNDMQPEKPRYNLPTQPLSPVTGVPVSQQGMSSPQGMSINTPANISTGPKRFNGKPVNANGNDVMALKHAAANAVKNTPRKA